MITLLIYGTVFLIIALLSLMPNQATAQQQQTGSVLVSTGTGTFGWLKQFQGWGITKDSNSTSVTYKVDTGVVMSVSRASDSIASLKTSVAAKLASSSFTKAAMIALGMLAYSDSGRANTSVVTGYDLNKVRDSITSIGYLTAVPAQSFASLTGKPTTLSGYGITDAYPLTGNPSAFLTSITSGNVTTALGFTPVTNTRTISTTSPLAGGGDLSANRTLTITNSKADNTTLGAATFDSTYFNDNGSGLISYGVNYGTGSVSAAAVTINHPRGKITYTSPSITAGTAIAVTFTNSFINATSTINIGLNGNGSNLTLVNAYVKSQTSGSRVINIQNLSLLSLFNSTFVIDYFIVN